MSDVKCPYCGEKQEINHDDGAGYAEDVEHSQDCTNCGEEFKFTTSYTINYEVFCRDGDHDLEQSAVRGHSDLYSCSKCDYYEVRRD